MASFMTSENFELGGRSYEEKTCMEDPGVMRMNGDKNEQFEGKVENDGEWSGFDVQKWRSAMNAPDSYHAKLQVETTSFVNARGDELGGADKCLLIEVGSGTGEPLLAQATNFKYLAGFDFNRTFVNFSQSQLPEQFQDKAKYMYGNATELEDLLTLQLPLEWLAAPRVVVCVGNTIGIMPESVKPVVVRQMAVVAGPSGVCVMVFWNGNRFGDAVQHFYHTNPQLCGPFRGDSIDLDTCTLSCPSGYRTHWTKPEEAWALLHSFGVQVVSVEESSDRVGVMAVFKMPPTGFSPVELKMPQTPEVLFKA